MDLIKAFEEIDKDFSGEITKDELRDYMEHENYELGLIQKWMLLFDKDGDGKITFEEYCNALGLEPNEHIDVTKFRADESNPYDSDEVVDVEIYKEDPRTNEDFRQFVINTSHKASRNHDLEKDIAKEIKVKLDQKYGRMWHCAASRTTFGCNLSHLPGGFMHYKIEDFCYLIWQTPAF